MTLFSIREPSKESVEISTHRKGKAVGSPPFVSQRALTRETKMLGSTQCP